MFGLLSGAAEKRSHYYLEISSLNATAILGGNSKSAKLAVWEGWHTLILLLIPTICELMRTFLQVRYAVTQHKQQFEKMRFAGFKCLGGST